jgi:hypothetical protein
MAFEIGCMFLNKTSTIGNLVTIFFASLFLEMIASLEFSFELLILSGSHYPL